MKGLKMLKKDIIYDFSRAKHYFENISTYMISPYGLLGMIKKNVDMFQLIDVRDYDDYIDGHIEFAEHIPVNKLEENLDMLDKEKITIFYCYNSYCLRAVNCALKLVERSYPAAILDGGMEAWEMLDFDVVRNSSLD